MGEIETVRHIQAAGKIQITSSHMIIVKVIRPDLVGIDMDHTGKKLKQLCQERGLSVAQIKGDLYLCSFQSIYAWFSGKTLPNLDNLYLLSKLLGVPIDEMIIEISKEVFFYLDMEHTGRSFKYLILHIYHSDVFRRYM